MDIDFSKINLETVKEAIEKKVITKEEGDALETFVKATANNNSPDVSEEVKKKAEAAAKKVLEMIDGQQKDEGENEETKDDQEKQLPELSDAEKQWQLEKQQLEYAQQQYKNVTLDEVTASTKTGETAIHQMESVDMAKLIGAPLTAAVEANFDAAKKMLSCVKEIGIKDNTLTSVTFTFFKNGRKCNMTIPLLTLVPINSMIIKEMTYDFKLKIDTSSSVKLTQNSQQNIGFNIQLGSQDQKGQQEQGGQKEQKGTQGTNTQAKANPDQPAQPAPDPAAAPAPASNPEVTPKNPDDKSNTSPTENKDTTDKKTAAAKAAVKDNVKVDKTFGVTFSSKRDSSATQESKYSVETSMDVKLTIGPDQMPGGISKLLEILNDTIEVYNPDGELTVSASNLQLVNGYAMATAIYYDTTGALALSKITCSRTDGKEGGKVELSSNGSSMQILFDTAGKYTVQAEKLKYNINVIGEAPKTA